jgi:hypothetical protein
MNDGTTNQRKSSSHFRITEQEVRKIWLKFLRTIEQHILQHTPNPSQEGN